MNCVVVDDNKLARTALVHLIEQVDNLELVEQFENPVDAVNFINRDQVDLVFLDVEMPAMSGLDVVKSLEKRPIIILITAKVDYAIQAFELNVADYIVKPVTLPRFLSAVAKAKDLFENTDHKLEAGINEMEFIFVKNKTVLNKILLDDILFVQAMGDYVTFHTSKKTFTIHITLTGIEKRLPTSKFFRVHRSYIVSIHHIDQIEGETIYINHNPIPVGEQYKQSLLKKINFI